MEQHDDSLERACVKRDVLVDRLLRTKDYRVGSTGAARLIQYLSGNKISDPTEIPTQLRQAQDEVLGLMANEVDSWKS